MSKVSNLKPCPCGKVPSELRCTTGGGAQKYCSVAGTCCGEWAIKFRNDYDEIGGIQWKEKAAKAWNESPRAALSEPAKVEGDNLCKQLQKKCVAMGVYWRSSDEHGVCLNVEQATDLLRDALGVEVEIEPPATPAPGVAPRVEMDGYVVELLIAAGFVSPDKVQQARDIAARFSPPSPVAAVKAVREWPKECDWHNHRQFTVWDDPDEHEPCWLVMPDGGAVKFNHHATNGVDQARAKFIADACNAALAAAFPEKEKG